MIYGLLDMRGGFCTNIPYELMKANELLQADNCFWGDGLEKRLGYAQYESYWSSTHGLLGVMWAEIASSNFFVYGVDFPSEARFYYNAGSTSAGFTVIASGSVNMSNGYDIEFAKQYDNIFAVNGQDYPVVVRSSGTAITAQTIQEWDTRERGTSTWYAGQYHHASTSVPGQFINDTNHAQGTATASGFQLANTTASDGFWFACAQTFNKFEIASVPQFVGGATFTASYQIYVGSGSWSTPVLVASASWTGSVAGSRLVEWNWAKNWTPADEDLLSTELANQYVLRVKFHDVSATYTSGQASLTHTQYLDEVTDGDKPQAVCIHNNRVCLAARYAVYQSEAYPQPGKGWLLRRAEYFYEGGENITQIVSFKDYLLVFKEDAIYGLYGNSLDTWVRKKIVSGIGAVAKRSVVSTGNEVFFVNNDGIYMWNGQEAIKVSKHVQSTFDTLKATASWGSVCGAVFEGQYWLSWGPTADRMWRMDPDTFRRDSSGDGQISIYQYKNYGFNPFTYNESTERLYGVRHGSGLGTSPALCVLETASYGDTCWASTDAINMQVQTRYGVFGNSFMEDSGVNRFKVKQQQASASAGQYSSVTVYADDGAESVSITCTSPVGAGTYADYWTLPYNVDGKNLSFHYQHGTAYKAKLIGYSLETYRRYY